MIRFFFASFDVNRGQRVNHHTLPHSAIAVLQGSFFFSLAQYEITLFFSQSVMLPTMHGNSSSLIKTGTETCEKTHLAHARACHRRACTVYPGKRKTLRASCDSAQSYTGP